VASGLFFCSRAEAAAGMEAALLAGVSWRGVASALFSGVELAALRRSASDSFLARVDSEQRRTAAAGSGGAA